MMISGPIVSFAPHAFRQALAQFASGVTVVTASHAGARFGFTASSFTSVSLDPPLVLVCAARRLEALSAILAAGAFGVSVLGVEQRELGLRFAGLLPDVTERFDGVETVTAVTGAPLLPTSPAWLDCRLWQRYEGGDHVILVGEVVDARVEPHHVPLLYHARRWQRPAALEDASETGEPPLAEGAAPDGPVSDLPSLLRHLQPSLDPDEYAFVAVDAARSPLAAQALASFREREALTLILRRDEAARAGVEPGPGFRRITLAVHSSLLAVGLLAAVSRRLADAGIACNVVSAYHHDHVFVPAERAHDALVELQALASGEDPQSRG